MIHIGKEMAGTMMAAGAAAAAVGAAGLLRSFYEREQIETAVYELRSEKVKKDRTFVFLSDLHNHVFGKDNERLLDAIDRISPDAVLVGGDMMVAKRVSEKNRNGSIKLVDTEVPLRLFGKLAKKYSVYYGNGNHENRMEREKLVYGDQFAIYRKKLEHMGVIYLSDEGCDFEDDIRIWGLDLESGHYRKWKSKKLEVSYIEERLGTVETETGFGTEDKRNREVNLEDDRKNSRYQILLSHSPMFFETYTAWGADLTLAGHFHGGTIRLPILGGVMTPQFQFFLPWCRGCFHEGERVMIVSPGLGTHSINIRINNKPQVVVVKVKRQTTF